MNEDEVLKKLPFLNVICHNEVELVGVIQNSDDKITSFYDFDSIQGQELKEAFLKYCDEWWYESNRMLPINIFIGKDMALFKHCLKTFSTKEVNVMHGPITSLENILKRGNKKNRQITLIRTM